MIGPRRIAQENRNLLRRQSDFRLAAEHVAGKLTRIPSVTQVVVFGSVVAELRREIPRFREFRRAGVALLHECKDVDLAVWISDLKNLRQIQKARTRALTALLAAENIGVAHHQVDIFLIEPGTNRYLGRLCNFAACPKPAKLKCSVPGCGTTPFLQQHPDFVFDAGTLRSGHAVVLFDRNMPNLIDGGSKP